MKYRRLSERIQATVAPYFEAVQRAFNVQGAMPQDIALETQLGVTIADLRDPEYVFLRRTARFEAGNNLTAGGAGVSSIHEFENPVGSNVMAVVDITLQQNGAAASQIIISNPNSAAAGLAVSGNRTINLDTRQPINGGTLSPFPVCIIRTGNIVLAALSGPIYQLGVPAIIPVTGFVVMPGWWLRVQPFNANQGVAVGWRWSERALTPQEQ